MKWFALALCVWLLAFLACLGALLMPREEEVIGEIALEHSAYCDQFVVKTQQGYVTLDDPTGNARHDDRNERDYQRTNV